MHAERDSSDSCSCLSLGDLGAELQQVQHCSLVLGWHVLRARRGGISWGKRD